MALTPKMHAFARAVARGKSLSDSYREAYDAERMKARAIQVEASKLAARPDVSLMIDRLRCRIDDATVAATLSDRERVLQRLRVLLDSPEGTPAENVALKAAALLGQSVGLFQKRVEIDDRRDRSAEDVRAELLERLALLADEPTTTH